MRPFGKFLATTCATLALTTATASFAFEAEPTITERDDLLSAFNEQGVEGTFALYTAEGNSLTLVGAERANTPFLPASTFKVANSIIALETGAVADMDEKVASRLRIALPEHWAAPMGLAEAMAVSNVPVFEEVARRVGPENYKVWMERLDYGNQQISEQSTRFWLDGPLETTAVEQVEFLDKLSRFALPATDRSQHLVKDAMLLEEATDYRLYGKTGWTDATTPGTGWFVGWVEKDESTHAFALNMDMDEMDQAPLRPQIAKQLLAELGVL